MISPSPFDFDAMRIPTAYRHCDFDSFQPQNDRAAAVMAMIQNYTNSRRWIIICGPASGIGKTHLAVSALLRAWTTDLYVPKYSSDGSSKKRRPDLYCFTAGRELGENLDAAGANLQVYRDSILTRQRDFDHMPIRSLLIDELGREPERARSRVETIIDVCFSKKIQLIATSNFSPDQLKRAYDPAIIRRLVDRGSIFNADWPPPPSHSEIHK